MDKRIGSSAGLLALVALLVHLFGGSPSEETSRDTPATETGGKKADGKTDKDSTADQAEKPRRIPERQGPWKATQQYFHSEIAPGNGCLSLPLFQPEKCGFIDIRTLYGFPLDSNAANVQFLIATIPDPLHTRLSLETDRDLDAVQQAAFHSGWELATQWLPWTPKVAESPETEGFDLEKLPGLLVFRHHFQPNDFQSEKRALPIDELLLVFVVGETPTAGVNGFQFTVAQQTIHGLFPAPQFRRIRIAGPRFSGSFSSLTELLKGWDGDYEFDVHAGTVSNSDYALRMLDELANTRKVTFHGSTLPSTFFNDQFKRLAEAQHLNVKTQAAELIEDETGFSFSSDMEAITVYRYPRDVAQLRNRYNDAAFSGALKQDGPSIPGIEFSLKDTQSGEDIFPMFSTSHTPASQNAQLQAIIHDLNRKNIRIVSLSATNVFDTLFLANVLTRECPDTRIVLRGPDLLFVQEAAQGSLSGVMAISAFPLYPEGTRISGVVTKDITTYADADQIGEYNAVLSLLHGPQTDRQLLTNFQSDKDNKFAVWLLELSPSGWLPIDLSTQSNQVSGSKMRWFEAQDDSNGHETTLPPLPSNTFAWNILCLFDISLVLLCCLSFWKDDLGLRDFQFFQPLDVFHQMPSDERGDNEIPRIVKRRNLSLLSCFASLAFITGLLAFPMWSAHSGWIVGWLQCLPSATSIPLFSLVVDCLVSLAFAASLLACGQLTRANARRGGGPMYICAIILGAYALAFILWGSCCVFGNNGYFVCFRTLTLATPVSPIVPLLLTGSGLFLMGWFHLCRFTWRLLLYPEIETSLFGKAPYGRICKIVTKLENAIALPCGRKPTLQIPIILVVSATLYFSTFKNLGAFEPRGFLICGVLAVPLSLLTLFSFIRLWRCWRNLRMFLLLLNGSSLGPYFDRIVEFSGSGPIWTHQLDLMSPSTAANSLIALRNFRIAGGGDYALKYEDELNKHDQTPNYQVFREKVKAISKELSELVSKYWNENKMSFVGSPPDDSKSDTAPVATQAAGALPTGKDLSVQLRSFTAAVGAGGQQSVEVSARSSDRKPVAATAPSDPLSDERYKFASKYLALQYSLFICYVMRQLRNLLMCSTVCFVLLLAALNSYTFQAPHAIFNLLSLSLLVAGPMLVTVLMQMERNPILSRLTGTPETLGTDFYIQILTYVAVPVLAVVHVQFPSLFQSVSIWANPFLSKLH